MSTIENDAISSSHSFSGPCTLSSLVILTFFHSAHRYDSQNMLIRPFFSVTAIRASIKHAIFTYNSITAVVSMLSSPLLLVADRTAYGEITTVECWKQCSSGRGCCLLSGQLPRLQAVCLSVALSGGKVVGHCYRLDDRYKRSVVGLENV